MTAFIYLSNLCADYPGPGALRCHLSQISKKVHPGCNDMAHIVSRTMSCDPFVALWDGVASLSLSFGVPLASLGIPWGAYRIAIHFLCKCTKIINNTVGWIQLEFAPLSPLQGSGRRDYTNSIKLQYYVILCYIMQCYPCLLMQKSKD